MPGEGTAHGGAGKFACRPKDLPLEPFQWRSGYYLARPGQETVDEMRSPGERTAATDRGAAAPGTTRCFPASPVAIVGPNRTLL